MRRNKKTFAMEIISSMKRQRNFWMAVAAAGIALNIIQWVF